MFSREYQYCVGHQSSHDKKYYFSDVMCENVKGHQFHAAYEILSQITRGD